MRYEDKQEREFMSQIKQQAPKAPIKPKSGKSFLDRILERAVSRKLLVFSIATALLIGANLDPDTWAMIAVIYIGGQSAIDIAKVWKGMS